MPDSQQPPPSTTGPSGHFRNLRVSRRSAGSRSGSVPPFLRPEFIPNADVRIAGIDNIPATGGAIIVGNHRSYFDPAVMITDRPLGPKRSTSARKRCSTFQ